MGLPIPHIVLPLAISFYTFLQVAYLCDTYDGLVEAQRASSATWLFVTFFPHLIAGPIAHHGELTPQFADAGLPRVDAMCGRHHGVRHRAAQEARSCRSGRRAGGPNLRQGAARRGGALGEAWLAPLAPSHIGLYFDFSGYSDMAVGLARMFGIRLPYNFASPYQAISIIEFSASLAHHAVTLRHRLHLHTRSRSG